MKPKRRKLISDAVNMRMADPLDARLRCKAAEWMHWSRMAAGADNDEGISGTRFRIPGLQSTIAGKSRPFSERALSSTRYLS
ncbi:MULTISPECIES: hypothetical protein [unclassified Burkholderia]|uniref:hypothetical protein n=1 Tax=unclassified Burkholderia TaxID=2613784 RepID=UPI0012E3600C|nr:MULTISPECIES: hypothetical protein [unclassified Burkholderia]